MPYRLLLAFVVAGLVLVGCGGKAGSHAAAGTYELDRTSMVDVLVEEARKALPEESRDDDAMLAEVKAEAQKQAEAMSLTTVLGADGTWTATGDMAGNRFSAKGTWKLEGTQLSLTTTEKDGEKPKEAETKTATLEGAVMTIQPEGAPFKFMLVRK